MCKIMFTQRKIYQIPFFIRPLARFRNYMLSLYSSIACFYQRFYKLPFKYQLIVYF